MLWAGCKWWWFVGAVCCIKGDTSREGCFERKATPLLSMLPEKKLYFWGCVAPFYWVVVVSAPERSDWIVNSADLCAPYAPTPVVFPLYEDVSKG